MNSTLLRKSFVSIAIIFSLASICMPDIAIAQRILPTSIQQKLAELEASSGGRLGISAMDTANNMLIAYRADERFPFCSTAKVMTVAAILKKSMADDQLLQKRIIYTIDDVDSSGYAPITKNHIADGMTISELCAAAIEYSDNTAMNLLLKELGGTEKATLFARSIGDNEFRLDRIEPDLNSAIPGDLRDTITPNAVANDLQKLMQSHMLALAQRKQLIAWLQSNTTGNARIRAGVPNNWVVGDKTGTGDYGTTNDVAIIWPPHCEPLIVAIYFTQNKKDDMPRDDVIASATHLLVDEFAGSDQCINLKTFKK